MKKFALIGAAGFVAPRHLKAIKDTGNVLVAALDKNDSVGVLDSYFPDCDFFTEFERFDRHLEKLRRKGEKVDFVTICSPNYLHDAHIRFALRQDADAICEKPIVLNPWNVDGLVEIASETKHNVNAILQLRLHPVFKELKNQVEQSAKNVYDLELTYITSRGNWYHRSWKGDIEKSGGVATNIGIHFFDVLIWIFGPVLSVSVAHRDQSTYEGELILQKAKVKWLLSVDYDRLPKETKAQGKRAYRSLRIDGEELEFSEGFVDLHTESYKRILLGEGFGLQDAKPAIELARIVRNLD